MNVLTLFGMSIGLSMDAFAVSLSIGMNSATKGKHALIAGVFFGLAQALLLLLGYFISFSFLDMVEQFGHYVAFVLLVYIGGKMIYDGIKMHQEPEAHAHPLSYGIKDFLLLALATSIDAFAVGVTFAFFKVNIWLAMLIMGGMTTAFAIVGVAIGEKVSHKSQGKAEFIGGLLLILIGLSVLLQTFL